jgi:hypothetical protein
MSWRTRRRAALIARSRRRRDGPRSDRRRIHPSRGRHSGSVPERRRQSEGWSGASAFGSQGGSIRCGPSPGRAMRTSSASWPTAPAKFCWCSKVGDKSQVSSPGRASSSRAWSATGPGGKRSSIPHTSWYRPTPRRRSSASEPLDGSCAKRVSGMTLALKGSHEDAPGGSGGSRCPPPRAPRVKLPGRSPVANVPPGPASGATSPARRPPGVMTSTAMVLSAAAPHGGGRLHPLPARRTGTERAHRE